MKIDKLPKPRPTFVLASALPPEEVRRRVKSFLKENEHIKGVAFQERLELAFTGPEQHLWSPQLIVDYAHEGEGSRLTARFGPHPHVWTMYTGIYFVLGILGFLSTAYAYSQSTLHEAPTALWALPGLLVLAGLTYGAPFVGQGLGFEQMYALRSKLVELTESEEVPSAAAPP